MNPGTRIMEIPPPPGTEDFLSAPSNDVVKLSEEEPMDKKSEDIEQEKIVEIVKKVDIETEIPVARPIDRINPYIKNPDYVEYEKKHLDHKHRIKSRSRSREKHHKRRYSRSRSRDRYRRSRSRSRRRRRRYSSSRSRSRSPSYRRHKYSRKRRSTSRYSRSRSGSRSRSKSTSRSRQKSYKSRSRRDRKSPPRKPRSVERDKHFVDADTSEIDMKLDEEEEDTTKDNVFKNDGSFLEMFKKMQEQQKKAEETAPSQETTKKILPVFGKRRGGKVLKTGLVQKVRLQNEEEGTSQDAWSVYMKEVRKYKEACCDDDSKTRPLVK